jgi:hypothetical protein
MLREAGAIGNGSHSPGGFDGIILAFNNELMPRGIHDVQTHDPTPDHSPCSVGGRRGCPRTDLRDSSGYENTAIGYDALSLNTIGYDNDAFGVAAPYSNTSGFYDNAHPVSTTWR